MNLDEQYSNGVESVAFLSDGGFVVGGFRGADIKEVGFKSGGQVNSGKAFIGKISAADAAGSSAPTAFQWIYEPADVIGSAKAIRVDSSDNIYTIVGKSGVAKLTSSGTEIWKTNTDETYQLNDLEVNSDSSIVLTGLIYGTQKKRCRGKNGCGTIFAYLTKLSSTGSIEWSKEYGNYRGGVNQFTGLEAGDNALIYNECWGLAKTYATDGTTHTGYAMACGTGVEGCKLSWALVMRLGLWTECRNDKRIDWRALTIATDLNGDRLWHRQDNFQTGEAKVGTSASEYIFSGQNGKLVMVTDEALGIGLG